MGELEEEITAKSKKRIIVEKSSYNWIISFKACSLHVHSVTRKFENVQQIYWFLFWSILPVCAVYSELDLS